MAIQILNGDCRETMKTLPAGSVHTCITSPPYWGLRDYGHADQLGLEATPEEYVAKMVGVFREVKRVLRDDGTLWLNLGDSYAAAAKDRTEVQAKNKSGLRGGKDTQGSILKQQNKIIAGLKPKDLAGIPWMVAFALRADGWYLRSDIIWHKPNPMPEPVTDRPSKAHEYIFLMSKAPDYYYDIDATREPWKENPHDIKRAEEKHQGYAGKHKEGYNGNIKGQPVGDPSKGRNKRTVWTVPTHAYSGAHFATFPPDLIEPCVLAGSPKGGSVLDPFGGAGTTALVADRHGRNAIICELNPSYVKIATDRLSQDAGLFADIQTIHKGDQ